MGRADDRRARQSRGAFRSAPAPSRRRRRSSGGGIRRIFTLKRVLGTFFGLCLLGMGAFIALYLLVPVPEGNAQAQLQSNVFKYSDGKVLARTGEINRENVDLSEVPKDVQHTFVAAENKSFYQDQGVDFKGTLRGLVNTVSGKGKQGGSTITQQYVKNYYLTQDQTVTRKLKELVISLKVDRQKSKPDILAGYINTSYYGRGAYGIQAAAEAYYGTDAAHLNVAQGAYLAALLQAPNQYDWAIASDTGKKLAKERWNYVLDNMVEEHWLDAGKRQSLKFPVPHSPRPAAGLKGQEGYLVQAAEDEVMRDQHLTEAQFKAGGWTITLNIDRKKQQQLEKAVQQQLNDKLHPKSRRVDGDVQAGAVSVNPKTGAVVALYGGRGLTEHWTSNATRKDYQPASTFKPVILAAALDRGAKTQKGEPITADTIYDGTSRRHVVGSDVAFAPPNEDGVDYGPVTVQKAMNKSINSVFAQMGVDVGMDRVMDTAGSLGMDVDGLPVVPAQTLGSMSASPMEMAGVYATLDHHGQKVTPQIVKSAEQEGVPVELPEAIGSQAISRQAADSVTSVLTGVVNDGTGSAVRNPEQDVAGKTGTSDENKSAWFSGFTPKLVTSVGLFGEAAHDRKGDDGKVVKRGTHVSMRGAGGLPRVDGASFPARIWAAYTFKVMGEPSDFDLDTDMGAAVSPPPAPTTSAPSESPSNSAPPTTSAPPVTPPPGTGTSEPPSGGPSTPPSTPPTSPTVPPTATVGPPQQPATRGFGN
ncbi:transglycosylase domain-containing protein [Streptomyces odontomachi]|uniref:transglycosylase domain-containing protein n=1 Tax=Streptomyces odontomachi TaxID=2944940 RepID=UPI00210B7C13|nr:transglycosylase domain-containing protein [Streptomyces sp. ODS25]